LTELQGLISRIENEVNSANNRIEFNGERSHEQTLHIQRNERIIEKATDKKEQQEIDLQNADTMLGEVVERIDHHQEVVSGQEEATRQARQDRETLNASIREVEKESSGLKSRLAALQATIETNEQQADSDRQRLAQLTDEIARLQKDEADRSNDAKDLKERITKHHESIETFEESLAAMEQKYHQAKRAAVDMQEGLSSLHKLHAEKKSRLEVLEQLIADGEGFEKGTQSVLKGLNDPDTYANAVHQPLSNYLEVDKKFAEAIEAALGRQLQTVLVDDIEVAEKVIKALKKDNMGQASIFAADALSSSSASAKRGRAPLGSVCWADEVVKCRSGKLEPLIGPLLG
ncbi:MAG: hypothetical protein KAG66_14065, partial [Methylococcales bacterium]|nr:hypothetical protein [Methylococcales bacterium]